MGRGFPPIPQRIRVLPNRKGFGMTDNKEQQKQGSGAVTTDSMRGRQQGDQQQQEERTVTSRDVMALTPEQRQAQEQREQKVTVRALRTVHKDQNLQGEVANPGDEFETHRGRAAELRAHGIVEFSNESEENEAFKHASPTAAIRDRVNRDHESRKIPEQHKSSPLRNPKLELAEAPEDVRKNKR